MELRKLKILPDLVNINTKVSSPTIIDEYISQYNFNQDYRNISITTIQLYCIYYHDLLLQIQINIYILDCIDPLII